MAVVLATLTLAIAPAISGEWATKDEAQSMVRKAVAFIKSQGTDSAYKAFTGKDPQFTDRDLYVVVYQLDGKVLAHGLNQKLVVRT